LITFTTSLNKVRKEGKGREGGRCGRMDGLELFGHPEIGSRVRGIGGQRQRRQGRQRCREAGRGKAGSIESESKRKQIQEKRQGRQRAREGKKGKQGAHLKE
jgi:hypothetical protein